MFPQKKEKRKRKPKGKREENHMMPVISIPENE